MGKACKNILQTPRLRREIYESHEDLKPTTLSSVGRDEVSAFTTAPYVQLNQRAYTWAFKQRNTGYNYIKYALHVKRG